MNFSFDRFLKPLTSSDKNIKIYDNNNVVKYIINPFNVKTLNISNNLIYIHLESGRNMTLDFSTQNETKQAVQKLQLYVDTLKNSLVPYYIQHAVEIEAPNFTKGPTGSIGLTGSTGLTGLTGERGESGKSAYDIWISSNTGTQEAFFNSLIGPIGATGPRSFGETDELDVVGQSILATVDNKDIEIVTKGAGNLLFKIDRDGWFLKYGFMRNTNAEIWGSGSAIDDEGNIYTTGADYTSATTYITKTGKNGQLIWQKNVNFYSQGESILYSNGFIYILATSLDFTSYIPQIIKLNKNGNIIKNWNFDVNIDANTENPDFMILSEIAIDENDNIYYVGSQYNEPDAYDINYGITDMVCGKFNATSSTSEWFKVINGGRTMGRKDSGFSIKYKNGFAYVTGVVFNDENGIKGDIFVSKINKEGAISWSKVIGNGNYVEGISLTVDDDHFIYISGYYTAPSFRNFYMKLDTLGDTIWSKSIDNFTRTITTIEENGGDSLFIISTQANTSTPPRQSTDLYLVKIFKSSGNIDWQQYVYSDYRDSIWALLPGGVLPATGHRSITIDPSGKSIYITGLTIEGDYSNEIPVSPGATNSSGLPLINDYPGGLIGIYHNMFLMSYDQKSLPEGSYGNWNIKNATFSTSDLVFDYNTATSNTSVVILNSLYDGFKPTFTVEFDNITNDTNREYELTLFSPNTELYVKGIITIDDLYTLPRKSGTTGQILTYGNSGALLEWKLPTVTFGFNDYVEIANNILGATGMDGIFVDPILGTVSETYQFQFDDKFFTVDLPIGFEVSFMGVSYSTVYVGSNSYITFGAGYSNPGGYTKDNPPLPGIFIGAYDRSCQALYTKKTADQFVIRYEGSILPGGSQAPFVEIEWEITFNKNSSIIDVNIGNNFTFEEGTGLSAIKNTNEIYKELTLPAGTAFRILKGYGYRPVQANRLNYLNIEGLSYSVTEDPLNLGDDIINIDFSGLGGSGKFYYQSTAPSTGTLSGIQPGTLWYDSSEGYLYIYVVDNDSAQWVTQINNVGPVGPQGNSGSFTTLGTTGSNIFLDSDSIFHISSGIQNGMDQSLYTIESFGSDQGMYLQAELPIMLADQDNILFGIKDSQDNWAYYIKLTHNTASVGNMVIYDAYGNDYNVLNYGQTYNSSDIFSIYIDGEKVYFKINGITLKSTDFLINPSLSYRFFCKTSVINLPGTGVDTLSVNYNFEKFKFYPTVSVSNRKNLLPTSKKTTNYVVTLNDYTIRADATNNDVTITLPTAASAYGNNKGYEFIIKRVDSSLNNVYLNGDSGQLIDAFSTGGLTFSSFETKRVQSNGATWDIL